ncbi:HEPN domain-containing protein [Pasteurella multocida]|uniref:HEPN domain-containing protein n=1 Tax=Pasteurella multocida TaxID=747 RepID=UPI000DFDC4F8|nr:HEPN domain-containing protein [Pasteurella multocida]MCL7787271.1 HEPN domain-containing protein [Pasteurella multocida]MCL7794401.1 HEPN domain-containing protein [Pasteurella multocida]URI02481.1 HEPN domain-containing protein [Pasteurella multocida]SUB45972.1 Uncharacterised protein [Pasteurella multocida subsp. septica]
MKNILNHLEQCYKSQRHQLSEDFRLRIHRSLSWLKKSEQDKDLDSRFISLWIAFNAAYAKELGDIRDKATFNEFLLRICAFDNEKQIYNLVWKTFSQSIRLLLDNKFVFQPFWEFHNGKMSEKNYLRAEMLEREQFFSALEKQKTERILAVMFSRLYTLRNQIIHGGSTYNSKANREQLRDGCNILALLIPAMLQIMLEHHAEIDWGKPFYPYVKE